MLISLLSWKTVHNLTHVRIVGTHLHGYNHVGAYMDMQTIYAYLRNQEFMGM